MAVTMLYNRWKRAFLWASLGAQMVKNQPSVWGTWKEEMAIHSSICAWRISMDKGALQATVDGVTKGQT